MPTKFVEGATLRELATGKKRLVTLYYDYFIITRSVRRAQGLRRPAWKTKLSPDRDKARRQIARRRRLTVMAKVSRRKNRR